MARPHAEQPVEAADEQPRHPRRGVFVALRRTLKLAELVPVRWLNRQALSFRRSRCPSGGQEPTASFP
jgi:hypothetical protein